MKRMIFISLLFFTIVSASWAEEVSQCPDVEVLKRNALDMVLPYPQMKGFAVGREGHFETPVKWTFAIFIPYFVANPKTPHELVKQMANETLPDINGAAVPVASYGRLICMYNGDYLTLAIYPRVDPAEISGIATAFRLQANNISE